MWVYIYTYLYIYNNITTGSLLVVGELRRGVGDRLQRVAGHPPDDIIQYDMNTCNMIAYMLLQCSITHHNITTRYVMIITITAIKCNTILYNTNIYEAPACLSTWTFKAAGYDSACVYIYIYIYILPRSISLSLYIYI